MWVTCALGPYNFEFMTEVHEEIVATFPQVGGIFSNRWEGSGMCYCEHCRTNFRDYCGMDLPRTNEPARSGAPQLHCVAREAALRAVAAVGRGDPQDQSRRARYIANSGGAHQRSRHEDRRRTGADACSPTARAAAA